jgi:hypothetical protein
MPDNTQDQVFNSRIPGTGGDFIDDQDVEGHATNKAKFADEGGPEGAQPRLAKVDGSDDDVEGHATNKAKFADEGGPEGAQPRLAKVDGSDDDVEGHSRIGPIIARADGGPEDNARHLEDDDDVEGHKTAKAKAIDDGGPEDLYTGGASTQGEIIARGPNDNPHGER